MSEELLTTGLCWELDGKVSAEYAHVQPSLTFHCPDTSCLAKVIPARIKNVFFRAPGRHVPGCRWEKEIAEKPAEAGVSRPKPSPLLPAMPPTYLGRSPVMRRRLPPTLAQLRQLAERLEQASVIHPGTLLEVVDAWCDMTSAERADHPLIIANTNQNYASAFRFLPQIGPEISTLGSDKHIVFGGATVTLGRHFFFVTTLKKFDSVGGKLPISIRVSRNTPAATSLAELVDASITAFWHGPLPVQDQQVRYFSTCAPDDTIYDGLVVKMGHFLPC